MRSKLSDARRHVAGLRAALLSPSPEEIEPSLAALMEAVQCLSSVERELRERGGQHPELRSELQALRNELRVVNKLVEHGAAFYQGWARQLGAATGGYVSSGEAAPLTASGAVFIQG